MKQSQETVDLFCPELKERQLSFTLFFRKASGGHAWKNGTVENRGARTAQDLRDDILTLQTDHVRANWILLEVSTPTHSSYGQITGGHARMRIRRAAPEH